MKRILLLLIFSLLFVQCRKDSISECELNLPGKYFPAYPGSWWKYSSNFSDTISYTIAPNYQYRDHSHDVCYPKFDNMGRFISGNTILQYGYFGLGSSSSVSSPIYSLELNSISICAASFATFNVNEFLAGGPEAFPYRRITLARDTTILSNDVTYLNVLLVKEYNLYDTTHYYYDYFSKDIGLVKRDSINVSDTTNFIEILTLEDYLINN